MFCKIIFTVACIQFILVISENSINDYFQIYSQDKSYRGDMFPQKYLSVDELQPSMKDFSYYAESMIRVIDYFVEMLNDTDPNLTLGSYFMKGVLKRTLIDYGHILSNKDISQIKYVVSKAEDINSHYVYAAYQYGPRNIAFQFSRMFKNDEPLVYSIGKVQKNVMQKWINSNIKINNFIKEIDHMTLPREEYVALTTTSHYYLKTDSDLCVSRIPSQPLPIRTNEIKLCKTDNYCKDRVFKTPTVAYALSHQYLYILLLALTKRCYVISEEADRMHMEIMCSNMYRETVYLARRGYFHRDLFLEHISLCGMHGYEEFFRHNWFQKSASWVDEYGCVAENPNYIINRTRIYMGKAKSSKEKRDLMEIKYLNMYKYCQEHQMALTLVVLAHGMRYAAHHKNLTMQL